MSYNVSVQERQRSMSITISSLGSGFWVVSVFEFRLQATVPCKHSCAMEFADLFSLSFRLLETKAGFGLPEFWLFGAQDLRV